MLIPFTELLRQAQQKHIAICYFEAWDIYSLEAVVEAAEFLNVPVIIGFGGVMMDAEWFNQGGLERLAALGLETAKNSKVPMALILNEVQTYTQIVRGIKAGFNAVMLDSSGLPFTENIRQTRKVVETAHAVNVSVEAELGTLPDASGEIGHEEGSPTDPDEAARFVAETEVDALSVSIGNVHVMTKGNAEIDFKRLEEIHNKVGIPLVVHGGSGFPEAAIPQAIALGVTKVNIGTVLKQTFFEGVREALSQLDEKPNIQQIIGCRKSTDILQQGKLKMKAEVIRRLKLWSVHKT